MTRMNESGLVPLGRAVLMSPYEPERKKGVIEVPDFVQDRERTLDVRCLVIECGPVCWPDEPPRAKPGDVVMVAKMSGTMVRGPKDGQPYRLVNDRDIYCRVEHLGEAELPRGNAS